MRHVFLAAGVLLLSGPAMAQEPNCVEPQSQAEMTGCAGLDYEAADKELNAVWKNTLADAKAMDADLKAMGGDGRPGYEETLKKAQRAWIAYRDAVCEYEGYEARGGTMEPMLVNGCLARLTRTRTKELLGEPLFVEDGAK